VLVQLLAAQPGDAVATDRLEEGVVVGLRACHDHVVAGVEARSDERRRGVHEIVL
jgi:hypothetical protein